MTLFTFNQRIAVPRVLGETRWLTTVAGSWLLNERGMLEITVHWAQVQGEMRPLPEPVTITVMPHIVAAEANWEEPCETELPDVHL